MFVVVVLQLGDNVKLKICMIKCDLCKKKIDEQYERFNYRNDGLTLHPPCAVKLDRQYKKKYENERIAYKSMKRKYDIIKTKYTELKQKKLQEIKELITI